MKKIDPPYVDNSEELRQLSLNTRLINNELLGESRSELLVQYAQYDYYNGSPWEISKPIEPGDIEKRMHSLYESPPKYQLKFLKEFRDTLSPDVCPMCGGLGKGTLDHYLPKDDYPIYSIFSKNLVPACDCNSKRNTTVKGDREPERVIHPYYDDFIVDRVYKSKFSGTFDSPRISMVLIDESHEQKEILVFHLVEVILNNKILDWLEKRWAAMLTRPHKLLRSFLPNGQVSMQDVREAIEEKLEGSDEEYDTPNNWWSFFYAGLLDCDIRLSGIANKVNEMRG